jgi:16S rRNA (cytosine1402-N4)-methyltransferase
MSHIPVLLNEVLKILGDIDGKTVIDATFGAGGYSRAFLERGANVIAFDRDPSVQKFADTLSDEFGSRFRFINAPFSEISWHINDAQSLYSPLAGESQSASEAKRDAVGGIDRRRNVLYPPPKFAEQISTPPQGGSSANSRASACKYQFEEHKHQYVSERIRDFAHTMRQNMTLAEKKFWYAVNNKKIGVKFCKQYPINDKYIADFICLEKKLIIEIDGSQHYQNKKDEVRTEYLQKFGFNVIRFWNSSILQNLSRCLDIIHGVLTNNSFEERLEEFNKNLPNMKVDEKRNVILHPAKKPEDSEIHSIVFDFGVSSMQLDTPERGFSFRFDAPLDMRMGCLPHLREERQPKADEGELTAIQLITQSSIPELTKILRDYGDIKKAGAIARAIKEKLPQTTFELKKLIFNPNDIAPVFQALRIAVNDELGEIKRALSDVPDILPPGGICAAVSFHSLEDRLVKNIFREWTTDRGDPRLPVMPEMSATFADIARGGISPGAEELEKNPRARSARLRAVKKY